MGKSHRKTMTCPHRCYRGFNFFETEDQQLFESFVNDVHPAFADLGEDLVVADRATDHDGQILALPDTW